MYHLYTFSYMSSKLYTKSYTTAYSNAQGFYSFSDKKNSGLFLALGFYSFLEKKFSVCEKVLYP